METGSINIGNVKFDKKDVKSTSVEYKNGQKLNCVFLNNGTKLTFQDQKADAKAEVVTGTYGDPSKLGIENGTGFFGIKGLSIEGSENDDYYHLTNCEDFNVNTEGGGQDEVRVFNNNGKHINGKINTDLNDATSSADNPTMMSMNEGFFYKPEHTKITRNGKPVNSNDIKLSEEDLKKLNELLSKSQKEKTIKQTGDHFELSEENLKKLNEFLSKSQKENE